MTDTDIKTFISGGRWTSIVPELRPSSNLSPAGKVLPFYLTRAFVYSSGDRFECDVTNYADPTAKVPLVNILISGHLVWRGEHPLAAGAYNVDYVSDESYQITPLHPGFADVFNTAPVAGLEKWEVNKTQDVFKKGFPAFGLSEGQVYVDYDLIYVYENLLFNGSKNVDGRPFDKPENRPTNLQAPLIRK